MPLLTCCAHHVLPFYYVSISLVKLTNALVGQSAVVKLQDVPDINRNRADLQRAHAVVRAVLHRTVSSTHILTIQNRADGRLQDRQHQRGGVRLALRTGICAWRLLRKEEERFEEEKKMK